jgi:hypothetical protein
MIEKKLRISKNNKKIKAAHIPVSLAAKKAILKKPSNLWTIYLTTHRTPGAKLGVESKRLHSIYKELSPDSEEMKELKKKYETMKSEYITKKAGLTAADKLQLKRFRRQNRGSVKPRRPNAFCMFVKEHKNILKEKGIAEGGKLLGAQWKALSESEKSKYRPL